jgi:hypothetical protein
MGAGQSLPSDLTHEKLFELTKDTRNIMNILLEYMLKEVTVRDFLALSDPSECKKYVLFKANTLHKYFYELQIVPTTDKRGVLAFRPVKELIAPQKEEAEKERQSLCLILAYYYTRIFQIYGALALTLIDDAQMTSKTGIMSIVEDDRYKLIAPGQRQYVSSGGNNNWLESDSAKKYLSNFYFLNSFLSGSIVNGQIKTQYEGRYTSQATIYFKVTSKPIDRRDMAYDRYYRYRDYDDLYDIPSKKDLGEFIIYYGSTGSRYVILNTSSSINMTSGDIVFTFGTVRYRKRQASMFTEQSIDSSILYNKQITIVYNNVKNEYRIKGSTKNVKEYFNDVLEDLVPYFKSLTEGDEYYTKNHDRLTKTYSEEKVIEQLRLSKTLQNLTRVKPLGHCIARALQLLQHSPFKDEIGRSSVCKIRFLESTSNVNGKKTTVSRSGLPIPGENLDRSPGLSALSHLFYDTIQEGSLKIGDATLKQYIEFMRKMARLFGDEEGKTDEVYITRGISGIKDRRDNKLCGQRKDTVLEIPANKTPNVYNYVKQLFRLQLIHSGKCGAIFNLLFNIERDKSSGRIKISLSDNIIKKGFSEIERINSMARQLLIDYYSNCEQTYLRGFDTVLKSTITKPASPPQQPVKTLEEKIKEAQRIQQIFQKEQAEKRIAELKPK